MVFIVFIVRSRDAQKIPLQYCISAKIAGNEFTILVSVFNLYFACNPMYINSINQIHTCTKESQYICVYARNCGNGIFNRVLTILTEIFTYDVIYIQIYKSETGLHKRFRINF